MARFRRHVAVVASANTTPAQIETRPPEPRVEPWIAAGELAELLRVSTDWIYEKAVSGELPSYVFGGHRRFRLSEIEAWAFEHASGGVTRRRQPRALD